MEKLAEIIVRYNPVVRLADCPVITGSKDAYELFMKNWNEDISFRESFYVMYLTKANRVKGISLISMGGLDSTIADRKLIFATALKTLSNSIILAHNHPSGNLKPSNPDISLTRKVRDCGDILDIKVLDHLIITTEGYYSFADEGML